MIEFDRSSGPKMTAMIKGKIIEEVKLDSDHSDDYFVLKFTDGSQFRILYDWIYQYEFIDRR